jgi:membrane protein DedA with SNARE-associated domain
MKSNYSKFLGYSVSSVSLLFGLTLFLDWWDFQLPTATKSILAIVLILLGVYRFLITWLQKTEDRKDY